MMKLKSRMIFHSLLVAVFVLRCVALSHDSANVLTYPGRVINTTTTQLGCPSDAKIETVIAEVKQDIRSLLHQVGMLVHVQVQCIVQILLNNIYSYINIWSYMAHQIVFSFSYKFPNKLLRLPKLVNGFVVVVVDDVFPCIFCYLLSVISSNNI